MKAFEYEAVVYDGQEYCVECLPEGVDVESDDVSPIFAHCEVDRPVVCCVCEAEHTYMDVAFEQYADDDDRSWGRSPHYDDSVQFDGESPRKPEV